MEIHAVEFPETGLVVPMVLCLPNEGSIKPGVCVYSGHSRHGLRDLVLDLQSYQRGIAVRLAQAGFVTIAVEKIDTGYLSRDGKVGVDEKEVASFGLLWGKLVRAHQLMACLAASEILAGHLVVDETRIGATGVSLGGWLSVQTALLTDRIGAVADFGRKTLTVPPGMSVEAFKGMPDLCHILPGTLALCDRHILSLAYCPRPMLAGHGRKDADSHTQGPSHYRDLYASQYEALGHADRFEYLIHDGGDTMPEQAAIEYFRRQFE
jgi:dienelactone hydrolase